jgi:hypothetical protein
MDRSKVIKMLRPIFDDGPEDTPELQRRYAAVRVLLQSLTEDPKVVENVMEHIQDVALEAELLGVHTGFCNGVTMTSTKL